MYPYNYNSFRFTPYILNYLYEGQVYVTQHVVTSILSGTSFYFVLQTNNRLHHVISRTIRTSGAGDVRLTLWENGTVTTPGTVIDLPPKSLDRRVGNLNPAQTVITHSPTGVNLTGAEKISINYEFSNAQGNNVGNTDLTIDTLERVYGKNKTIILQIDAVSGDIKLVFNYIFYESGN